MSQKPDDEKKEEIPKIDINDIFAEIPTADMQRLQEIRRDLRGFVTIYVNKYRDTPDGNDDRLEQILNVLSVLQTHRRKCSIRISELEKMSQS